MAIYETAWLRQLRPFLGGTTAAASASIAAVMAGLGIGALLVAQTSRSEDSSVRLYARLELILAVLAGLSPLLLHFVGDLFLKTGSAISSDVEIALRQLVALLVIVPPSVAMGGILPALTRGSARAMDARRSGAMIVYGLNTMGGAVGVAAGTFVLFETLGTRASIWQAAAIDGLMAATALMISHRMKRDQSDTAFVANAARAPEPAASSTTEPEMANALEATHPEMPRRLILLLAAATGFAFMVLELVWFRMLSSLLGGSVYAMGGILLAAFLGLGAGALMAPALRRMRWLNPADQLAFVLLAQACLILIAYAGGDRLAIATQLFRTSPDRWARAWSWVLPTLAVVFPSALIAGVQIPSFISLMGRDHRTVGRDCGWIMAINGAGSVAGCLAIGAGLLAWLTAPVTWKGLAILYLLLAIVVAFRPLKARRMSWSSGAVVAISAVVITLLFAARGPTAVWRHAIIGWDLQVIKESHDPAIAWANLWRRSLRWEKEGRDASVAVVATIREGYGLNTNGGGEGSARGDLALNVFSGLLGPLLRPRAETALVVGLGTGATAGWLASVPTLRRVDVIEIEPAVLSAAHFFDPVNRQPLSNPKVHVIAGDARAVLQTRPATYDLIVSIPSNLYRAGVAALFTEEYYRTVRSRLAPHGVFLQWVQAYDIDAESLAIVHATLLEAFSYVESWQPQSGHLLLVASDSPSEYRVEALRAALEGEPYFSAFQKVLCTDSVEGLFARYIGNTQLARLVAGRSGGRTNRDDRNLLEFRYGRKPRVETSALQEIVAEAWRLGLDRPELDQPIDDDRLGLERVALFTVDGVESPTVPGVSADRLAVHRAYAAGALGRAGELWMDGHFAPASLLEQWMDAEIRADRGEPDAELALADKNLLRGPTTDAILATLSWRQKKWSEASRALLSMLDRLRDDPWPLLPPVERAMGLTLDLAARQPPMAVRLSHAIGQPFSVAMLEEQRLAMALDVAVFRLPSSDDCARILATLEPNVPWTASFLGARSHCYEQLKHPLAYTAAEDITRLERSAGQSPGPPRR
jgi:predicted membrane-bound spermidine synthase